MCLKLKVQVLILDTQDRIFYQQLPLGKPSSPVVISIFVKFVCSLWLVARLIEKTPMFKTV